ncbi:MAG TPA: DegT/DnrJ/EryC1/StrS family aminotransferase [Candidatus Saccharimonadales bacterium]|nr:DegT/DnrJ/EryC1/StrS family aminotransferase [Candidatus Saccharimonadales bacterium]
MQKTIQISKPVIGEEEINAVVEVLRSGNLSQGPIVARLEKEFAKFCGTKYAVALGNGTATLHTALHALGVGPNDEVITSPFTFVATVNAILMQNAKVVFCDIEDTYFNIDPEKLEKKITKKSKTIMPVDLFGHIYDVAAVNKIAKKHKLTVVEDAAQSVDAEYKSKKAGNVADIASFSLYATKNLTAGVGGMLTTNSKRMMEKCKLFRHHGQKEGDPYAYVEFGYNYRMMDMIASIALEQLKKINWFTKRRRENAKRYNEELADIKGLILPKEREGYKHVYHQYTLRVTKDFKLTRDAFITHLEKNNIQARIYYPKPLHLYPHLKYLGYKKGDFPVAEKLADEVVSIPVHPLVEKEQIDYIIKTIKNI